ALLILLVLLVPAWAFAQVPPPTGEGTEEAAPPPPPPTIPDELSSPQATMRTFLEAFYLDDATLADRTPAEVAADTLDLSQLPPDLRASRGPGLAVELKAILDRTELIDIDALSDQSDADPWVREIGEAGRVVLDRDDIGAWRFTADTVAAIPVMLDAVQDIDVIEGVEREGPVTMSMWLRSQVPTSLRSRVFLLEAWQWLGLLILIFVGMAIRWLVSASLQAAVKSRLGKNIMHMVDASAVAQAMNPLGLTAAALFWRLGLVWLGLPADALVILGIALRFIIAASLVLAAYRAVNIVTAVLESRAARTENKFDDMLVPFISTSLKVFIAAFGLVFIAESVDADISSLLAGLGIGGLALALASQDAVKNLFGSLTVILDRPFNVGDWVKIEGVEGTVTEVGFRSTRIRTFYDSMITLPNANLLSAAVDNLGARQYRRWSTHLSLTYDTPPEKVEAFCEGVRELVRSHPYTRKDSFHVYLHRFSASSIDVLLYVFFKTPDWATELRERHRLALDIMRLAHELGVEFAFDTQTLYLHRGAAAGAAPVAEGYKSRVEEAHLDGQRIARALTESGLEGHTPPPVGGSRGSAE
ncbi:MAG: mechanosensitive ion channel domain-containing protein, partial [Acidobacteriota bacterium]